MTKHYYKDKCNFCDTEFKSRSDMRSHMRHTHKILREDWAMMQAENSTRSNRMNVDGDKQCYVCKEMFDDSLMNHRKIKHPSKLNCRDYLKNFAKRETSPSACLITKYLLIPFNMLQYPGISCNTLKYIPIPTQKMLQA